MKGICSTGILWCFTGTQHTLLWVLEGGCEWQKSVVLSCCCSHSVLSKGAAAPGLHSYFSKASKHHSHSVCTSCHKWNSEWEAARIFSDLNWLHTRHPGFEQKSTTAKKPNALGDPTLCAGLTGKQEALFMCSTGIAKAGEILFSFND